jgi:hypothetical protein
MAWDRTRASASSLKKVESTFLYNSSRFMEQHSFLEGSHVRSLWLYVQSNMYMKRNSQHWSNDTERRKPKYSKKNLFQGHFAHKKFHIEWYGIEPRPPCWKAGKWTTVRPPRQLNLYYVERTSLYLAVNTYCDQSRKLRGEIMAVYCQNHGTHECTVPQKCRILV